MNEEELAMQAADDYLARSTADTFLQSSNPEDAPISLTEKAFTPAAPPKEVPGFLKSAEMIGTGAMKGSLELQVDLCLLQKRKLLVLLT